MIGKVLDHQAKQITYNIYAYFKKRKVDPKNPEYVNDINIIDTVAIATGLSKSSVTRIIREGNSMKIETGSVDFQPLEKKKHIRKKRIEVDEFTESTIRRKVIQFYTVKNEVPSVRKLNYLLKQEKILTCSNEYLRQLLYKLGFTDAEDNSSGMLRQRSDIVSERLKYLQAIKQFRNQDKSIFFFNDTNQWVQDAKMAKPAEMPRLVIVHASGDAGFSDQAMLMMKMKVKSNSGLDDSDNYEWVRNKLLKNIPPVSVIVTNVSYCEVVDSAHGEVSMASTRATLQEWLNQHKVSFKETDSKADLFELIKAERAKDEYNISRLFKENGHNVLHLPQNHSDLNPAVTVWEELKTDLDRSSPKILLNKYSKAKWEDCFKNVENVEKEYYDHDMKIDDKDQMLQLKNVKEEQEEVSLSESEENSMDCDYY